MALRRTPRGPWVDEAGEPCIRSSCLSSRSTRMSSSPPSGACSCGSICFEAGWADKRCLDVGCGSGLLAVQLALNGAEHVHAIDIQRRAVANTLANAFRNGVADRVSGAEVDLYMVEPEERYDLVVASLYQMPVDPSSTPAATGRSITGAETSSTTSFSSFRSCSTTAESHS